EARRRRAHQRADPVEREPADEAALAPPSVRQLAAGDHQDRHDQQEQRDRRLDALDGGVQVLADVVDHHVHVRAREAADELSECQRREDLARAHAAACVIARAARISVRWLNACGKLPTWRPWATSYSSASRPRSFVKPSSRSNSARASSTRPLSASALTSQNEQA